VSLEVRQGERTSRSILQPEEEYELKDSITGKETILVFRIGQLGDALVSVPAIRAIREAHPDARLILLTDRHPGKGFVSSWEVFRPMGLFEEVYYLPALNAYGAMLSLALELRRLAPRMLYYLPPMPRTVWQVSRDWIFFRGLCGIRHFVGLRPTGAYPIRRKDGSLPRVRRESERLHAWIADGLPQRNIEISGQEN
jgi:hypothetical protein